MFGNQLHIIFGCCVENDKLRLFLEKLSNGESEGFLSGTERFQTDQSHLASRLTGEKLHQIRLQNRTLGIIRNLRPVNGHTVQVVNAL
ncbi:hypothetical protein D3C73_1485650 [compost metagenome]